MSCNYISNEPVTPKDFIDKLLNICPDNKRPLFCSFKQDPDNGYWGAKKISNSLLKRLYRPSNQNRYTTVSVFEDDRRRKAEFTAMIAVMIDDPGTKVPFENIVLPPTYWLETSPGNYQAWYFLAEPITDRAYAESIVNAMVAQGLAIDGTDPGMKGVTRYGRLPGGWNNKESLKTPHRVTAYEDTRGCNYYTAEQIIEAYELDLNAVAHLSRGDIDGEVDQLDIITAQSDPIYKMFQTENLIKYVQGHKIECTCPWVDEHTGETDNGTALLVQPGGGLGFKCHHGHCEDRTLEDVHDWLYENCPDEYEKYYPPEEKTIEETNETDEYLEDAIRKLFDEGASDSDIAIAIPDIAYEFDLSSYDVQRIVRTLKEEYEENEELKGIDLKTLADAVKTSDISLRKIFPKALAKALETKCESDKLDPMRPVQSLLPMIGSQLGTRTHILIKLAVDIEDDWIAYPFVSCIDIGTPSTGKTQTNKTITKPLIKQHDEKVAEYLRDREIYEENCRIARRSGNELQPEPKEPPELFVNGGTAEGILRKISELPPKAGMFYICDEAAGLISGADQYKNGKGDFKNKLLSAMSNPLKGVDARSSKENELIPFRKQSLSISGSIQPDRIKQLFDPNSDISGLASRFLCAYPRLPDDFDQWSETKVELFNELNGLVEYLQSVGSTDTEIRCVMDRSTYKKFVARILACRRIQKDNEENNPSLSGFIGKCPGHLGTLTLIQHWVACYYEEEQPGEITSVSFNRACYLLDYYIGQFRLLQIRVSGPTDLSKAQLYIFNRLKKLTWHQ